MAPFLNWVRKTRWGEIHVATSKQGVSFIFECFRPLLRGGKSIGHVSLSGKCNADRLRGNVRC